MSITRKSFLAKVTGSIAALVVGTKVVAKESAATKSIDEPITWIGRYENMKHNQRIMNLQVSDLVEKLKAGESQSRKDAKDDLRFAQVEGSQWDTSPSPRQALDIYDRNAKANGGTFSFARPGYTAKPKLIESDAIKAWRKSVS